MCFKLKISTTRHHSGVFIVSFDHSQHINVVFLLLTLSICQQGKDNSNNVLKKTKSDIFVS